MKGVLKEAGYAALKVRHQVYHCLETDLMAAIHGDDIIAEGEREKLDCLDEVLKRLVVVKVLDRIGPGAAEHGQYLKRHIVYINVQGFEWLEGPKHLAAIVRKPYHGGRRSRSVGRAGRGGRKAVSARYRHQHLRVQWKIRHSVLCEEAE